ncbi:patatin-like protein [Novosphingobium mangrovi (ex Huang et al. 2023)]|uniref:Patatin-like protein n=1 Tax=Novosphingobium mangrovi (ex Huang et al. 2023) TaxID=2976432 RepID=A0ABT2IAN8_9SPHN|nr:patatin-like protein [Novosphingobium mangrovi (ex Huang et al. 2023)]MCT2401868.1 patatin-like protein [Novosphingobium mangrovi (ex Huang et al. 2023)]
MRQKELRIALVCYGGVSLAVYMHGVTKEMWKALQASRAFWSDEPDPSGSAGTYLRLLRRLEHGSNLRLRVLTDIVAGASAGGINSVFLAQAIHSGQSLEPLTDLWLETADVDVLLDPEARPWSRAAKFWAMPLVSYLLHRPGNAVSASVAPETRAEVREKLSRLIRSRWFEPPFSGIGFSRLLCRAFMAMERAPAERPLLPVHHPLDLFVTATDFKGHLEALHLHSPEVVFESEHRLTVDFHAITQAEGGHSLAHIPELVLAARSTASFPGAFPPMQIAEIDRLVREKEAEWPGREAFLQRIMPEHSRRGDLDSVSLIDGSVLVNAPFADAMSVLRDRPATREVDRRFVYIDPTPDPVGAAVRAETRAPGFFPVIFGSLSSIPREQPIRDNLEALERDSREKGALRAIVRALRPEIEETVERLFGHTLFLDRPTPKRLAAWRAKAQQAALDQAGFAYHGYAQVKFSGIVTTLGRMIHTAAPELELPNAGPIREHLFTHLEETGIDREKGLRDARAPAMIAFFRTHDIAFRIRRLRLLARRVTQERENEEGVTEQQRDDARTAIYGALALYMDREPEEALGEAFPDLARAFFDDPGAAIAHIASQRRLEETDTLVDGILAEAMAEMPALLRRRMLLAYLGFPFYDTVTLPLLRGEGLTEFEPVRVDRISPEDCNAIRKGGAGETLRGTEFYNFGAFFSRAYRENDYLWGRLHGAERMIDLIASTLSPEHALSERELLQFRREAFLEILDEEEDRLRTDPGLVDRIRREVMGITSGI